MLITTKLYLPRPKPNAILRPRLLDMLRRSLDRKLITIVAVAGAGKTTLLAQAVAQLRLPAVYLSLDESDAELAVFFEYLAVGLIRYLRAEERSALTRALERELNNLIENVRRQPSPDMAAIRLINILAGHRIRDLYFILDDYHAIHGGSSAHYFLEQFLARMPSCVHFIVASRTAVGFSGLSQWLARQEITELTSSDLALVKEEVMALLSLGYGVNLSQEELQNLLERSRGWATGVHLIMQAAGMHKSVKMTLNGYMAANRSLFDYFANEIFGRESQETREFLQQVSILEELEPEACQFLTQRKDAVSVLAELEQRNAFISRNDSGSFSIHPLFKAFLRESIENRDSLKSWHCRAADFYATAGRFSEVIDHAIAGRDFARVARVLVGIYDQLQDATHFSQLARWMKEIPEEVYVNWPRLFLAKAWCLRQINDTVGQHQALEKAAFLLKRKRDRAGYCWALNGLADLRRQTDIAEAVRIIQKALRNCPPSERWLRANLLNTLVGLQVHQGQYMKAGANLSQAIKLANFDNRFYNWIRHNKAALHIYRGDNVKAIRIYQKITSQITKDNLDPETIAIFYSAFRAALEAGDPTQANEFIEQGRRLCYPLGNAISQLIDDEARAFWLFYQGQKEKSLSILGDIIQRYRDHHNENRTIKTEIKAVRFYRLSGRSDEAGRLLESICQRTRLTGWRASAVDKIEVFFNQAMLQAAYGRGLEAQRIADEMLDFSKRINCHQVWFYYHMIRARADGNESERCRHFLKALQYSQRYGYHGVLALEAQVDRVLSDILQKIPDSKYSAGTIRRLIQSSPMANAAEGTGSIKVRLLGTMEALDRDDKMVLIKWRTRKVKSLFAYLLLNRKRFCHREELIEALWPTMPLDRAKKELYHTACLLRKNLIEGFRLSSLAGEPWRDPVKHQSQSYRLNPHLEISIDVEELENIRNIVSQTNLVAETEEMLLKGMELYRDTFIPELSDRWVEKQREYYRSIFLFIAEKYGSICQKNGKLDEAAAVYKRVLEEEPLADQLRIQYWNVLKRSGYSAVVHRDYLDYARYLKKALGEEPSDYLEEAYKSLVGDDGCARAPLIKQMLGHVDTGKVKLSRQQALS